MSADTLDSDAAPGADGMPMLGLGTFRNDDHDRCVRSVRTALEMGYRHLDTARMYGNERGVGDGIADSDVDREEVFLATKVWHSDLGYEGVLRAAERSLDQLGTDYLDLLYVHWPAGEYDPGETLPAFDRLHEEGTIRHVGVSNFEPAQLDRARAVLDAPVFANQVELHPLLPQTALREYAADHGIALVAYAPIARGRVFDVPVLSEIAATHGVSEAQVSLAWLRERGVTAIPKATGADHIRDNWESLGLALTDGELGRIHAIERRERVVDPGFGPWNAD
ncbi:MAG: aldo/keto reductase [Haloarculaceae archaeon]